MAQGCNLLIDRDDLRKIKETIGGLADPKTRHDARGQARELLNSALNRPKDFQQILKGNPKDRNYELAQSALLTALNAEGAPPHEQRKLMPALAELLNKQASLPGLFEKLPAERGPGSSAMRHHYELTATAKLCLLGRLHHTLKTSTGINLAIHPTEFLCFGYKLAGEYALPTRNKNTFEGDTLFSRSNEWHAIDYKFTSEKVRRLHLERDFGKKLGQVASGMRDGQIASFTYVTNATFSRETKDRIFEENCKLVLTTI